MKRQITTLEDLRQHRSDINRIVMQYGGRKVSVFGTILPGDLHPTYKIPLMIEFERRDSMMGYIRLSKELSNVLGHEVMVVDPEASKEDYREQMVNEAKPL